MRAASLLACAVLLVGCAKSETPAADSAAVAPAPAAPAALSLADLAGKWKQEVRTETSDTVLTNATGEVTATADPAGWTIKLPGRPVMPLRITVGGDSLIATTDPFESVLRKGVQVSTDAVLRLQDGKLVGITNAHYKSAGADSVVRLRTEFTRVP